MDIVMLVISLFTDLLTVGIFAFFYSGKEQYREGMLLGVHIPAEQIEQEEVQKLIKPYKKSFRNYNLWNLLAGILVSFLSFTNLTIFLAIWMLWLFGYIIAGMGLVYYYHRKMYDIKANNHWVVERTIYGELVKDDDEYWKNGWYNNPEDHHFMVPDRLCSTNFSMNMARAAAKVTFGLTVAFVIVLTTVVVILVGGLDNAKIQFRMDNDRVMVEASYYKAHFNLEDIREVKIIEQLPEDDYTRTNGGATQHYLIGHFRGRETGRCMMFLYRKYTPILEVKLADETVYINSKNKGDVRSWYDRLSAVADK